MSVPRPTEHVPTGAAKRRAPGLANFVPAVAYHFCLALPAAFSQPGARFTRKIYVLRNVLRNVLKWIFDSETCPNYSISWKMSWAYWENGEFLILRFQSWFTRSKNYVLKNVLNSRHFSRHFSRHKFFLWIGPLYCELWKLFLIVPRMYQPCCLVH